MQKTLCMIYQHNKNILHDLAFFPPTFEHKGNMHWYSNCHSIYTVRWTTVYEFQIVINGTIQSIIKICIMKCWIDILFQKLGVLGIQKTYEYQLY